MDNEIYNIENLTHEQVRRRISERPAVIIPLGGCEPFGGAGVMGIETVCVSAVAREAAKRTGILLAPAVPFGCSTPFMAFHGSAGVKPRTFINMLCEIIHAYIFQGIETVLLISAAPFNKEPAAEAVKRLNSAYPKTRTIFFDINSILGEQTSYDRNDALLLSIYAHLRQQDDPYKPVTKDIPHDQYRTWKKRGMDPEKFRKLCPDGILLSPDIEILSENGRVCYDKIIEALVQAI